MAHLFNKKLFQKCSIRVVLPCLSGLCVAEITYGHCVTGTARLEADSGVKQRLISCISITVHCGSRTHRSARAYCFVCCSNKTALKWYCGALVLFFLIFFHKGYLLCCQGSRRTESPDCRFTKLRNSKNRNHRISIDSSSSSQYSLQGFVLTQTPREAPRRTL